jgi:hypothetical protein
MGLLDLFEKTQSISAQPQPNEGTHLPGYFELHQEGILIGGAIVVAVALLIAGFRYRTYLRSGLIIVLAAILGLRRKMVTKARSFWSEVEDRADQSL